MTTTGHGHSEFAATARLTLSDGGTDIDRRRLRTADQTLEKCLLDTQREVHRLEEIVHRLTSVAATGGEPPTGVLSILQERNRRLQREVDAFAFDSHAVMKRIRPASVPIAMKLE